VLPTTDVPNAPSYIEGIMNLRGRLASVVNFRKKLGFEPKEHDEDTRVIVVELDTFPIGIIVDAVEEVIKIPEEKVQKLPESTTTSVSRDYMSGVGMLDNRLIILLDVDKVLTSTELIEMGEITQMMEKAEEAPEPAESKKIDAGQPAATANSRTRGRTG
jgi:purine-binding chemotaxis protein CheW